MGTELFVCVWLGLHGVAPGADTLTVMGWNLENFFDWRNDSTSVSDADFSSWGERHWTRKRFYAKCHAIAKSVLWVASETGRLPDIIGVEEVEHAFVLRRLLDSTLLRKLDYRYVHFDSPDRRGIDVALLYRTSVLERVEARPCHLYEPDGAVMQTRDILLCRFRRRGREPDADGFSGPLSGPEEDLAVLVNHHPSKYGGAAVSEPRRRIAVERLRFLADSLSAAGVRRIIALGDFNDTPAHPVYRLLEPALIPLHTELYLQGEGTIKYDGKWDLIDHFYVSPAILYGDSGAEPGRRRGSPSVRMRVLSIPFLLVPDTAHAGLKPFRTYVGPRYTGGVSDHLPIWMEWVD